MEGERRGASYLLNNLLAKALILALDGVELHAQRANGIIAVLHLNVFLALQSLNLRHVMRRCPMDARERGDGETMERRTSNER